MDFHCVMVRYGEIGIKSEQIRAKYERLLVKNIEAMLRENGIPFEDIVRERGRIFVLSGDRRAPDIIARVFGVVSSSPVAVTGTDIKDVQGTAAALGRETIGMNSSFAIRARRAGDQPYTSQEIGRMCGDAVFEAVRERNPRVDLKGPDHEIFVEMRESRSYVFSKIIKGVGGMPMGSQGKMVALISGGIDSPVAAWLMMRRGCDLIPVFFNNGKFSDKDYTERAMDTIKKLKEWAPGRTFKIYEVPHGDSLREFIDRGNVKYTCVFCKHMMYRTAIEIAKKEGAHGLITGSSLGQVASQTSDNLMIEHYRIDFPIYHPLIGLDKNEIVEIARKIGTYDISVRPATCCKAVPKHPSIHGQLEEIERIEADFDMKALARRELDGAVMTTL
ncbi:probable thiamine biosynthesis protein ThiI [Methanocella paludicola SANAE]|uniref:Probable tRNA sulfurtransferase n=1 Tax=Methanocella paludicola (strain DSM 17711 / JCM 13418 / NBRC 101707 / SANAE) TaxID=304371 RepID=D1Z207_METPS|nr:tRNA uracil 4-sulfurtransferase ThiI [Methanocella paludicola]BAI62729.1 probable thiamine biosynthesis protein ThiI [Methanocella paludicola SANAE]